MCNKGDIENQQIDPACSSYSAGSVEELNLKPDLLNGIYALGFNTPSVIQILPTLLSAPPQNVIIQSVTSKTTAIVIAMLSRVDTSKKYPQIIYLTPTYELAIQKSEVVANMSQFCKDIKIRLAVIGEVIERSHKLTEHIIIGTPGKLVDWSLKFKVFDLKKIHVFVLDEADMALSRQEVIQVYSNLDHRKCQMILFSASYSHECMEFAKVLIPHAIILGQRKEEILDNIKQYYVKCRDENQKYKSITKITINSGLVIILCQEKQTVAWLAKKFAHDGRAVALLTGDLTVQERVGVLDRCRKGHEKILITTNILSRGVDIGQVIVIINFDLPELFGKVDYETYLHRIERMGHCGKKCIAINLLDPLTSEKACRAIEEHFKIKMIFLNTQDYDEIDLKWKLA